VGRLSTNLPRTPGMPASPCYRFSPLPEANQTCRHFLRGRL
jgi:hypothetical protein